MARKSDSPSSSWRKIQQSNRRTKTTKVARKRSLMIFFNAALVFLLFIAIITGIVAVYYLGDFGKGRGSGGGSSSIDVDFESDGVLTERWFRGAFEDVLVSDVRQVDVNLLEEQLEQYGQVASAAVTLSLPSNLVIEVEERQPILRMRVRNSDGTSSTLAGEILELLITSPLEMILSPS